MTRIVHLADQSRWEAQEGDRSIGYLSYELDGGVLDLQHTVVDPAARGQGLGGRLVEEALQYARAEDLLVRPTCPFVPDYLERHPEHADLVEGSSGAEVMTVSIRDQSIRLGQLLKLAGLVPDGAMARMVIENGEVMVDGEVSMRRGTQIRPGQVVSYAGEEVSPVHEG